MGIHQLWQERQAKLEKQKADSTAQKDWERKHDALLAICDTEGFDVIVKFFEAREKGAISLALATNGLASEEAKMEARVCQRFLSFLKNIIAKPNSL